MITAVALAFLTDLVRRFRPGLQALLAEREAAQARYDAGELPAFRPETRAIRQGDWRCAPLPADLVDRRVEITGPVDRKMVINALNSGANVFMADFEDANSPTWGNIVEGHQNIGDAVRRTIEWTHPETGKEYRLAEQTAVLMVRPRGLHLLEKHVEVDGEPVPAWLFDVAMFVFHNAAELVRRGTGPYLYLPKLQSWEEARWCNDVFVAAQSALGLPLGTIKATVLIETIPAAFQMDEILWALRDHAAGLNCGRWDYIFSLIKTTRAHPDRVLPDRGDVGMTQPFMRAYTQSLIRVCHRRGVHAMGGMAAQIPIKHDRQANEAALQRVRADKQREAADGHDGTWVAHPGLVALAREAFPRPNQLDVARDDAVFPAEAFLEPPTGNRTEEGLRHSVRVGVQYIAAWLDGRGCVPLYDLMEDAATAEICRAQIWQWIRHGALEPAHFSDVLTREVAALQGVEHLEKAADLFHELCTSRELAPFLTVPAYDLL